ncbi:endogenous inhibitor of DNA gyrase (YacG/DUF329 family) [Sphingomonas sp. F9_3S_D5_B_2]
MAFLTTDCPHCGASSMKMSSCGVAGRASHKYLFFLCPACTKPVSAEVSRDKYWPDCAGDVRSLHQSDQGIRYEGWAVTRVWPKATSKRSEFAAPAGTPPAIGILFAQAEHAFARLDHQIAALGYRRVLEDLMRDRAPLFKGALKQWILELVTHGNLPPSLKKWASSQQGLRGEPQPLSQKEVEELAAFTRVMLEYSYLLEGTIAALAAG